MSYFNQTQRHGSMVHRPIHSEINKPPRQFCDYMNGTDNRFSEICRLYLDGMSMDDVKYLREDDFISLVPKDQYKHKMLMIIMIRRYLYRHDETCSCSSCVRKICKNNDSNFCHSKSDAKSLCSECDSNCSDDMSSR
jgi:hypothetical protein